MDAYSYIRVSKELQAVNGISLEAQTDLAVRWAGIYGHSIVKTFSDEDSCRNTNRPGFQAMVRELMLGRVKMVIVYRLDRLFGNTAEALEYANKFHRWGVQLASISEQIDTTTPMGKYFYTNLAALGELRIQEIGARTKMGLAYLKRQGLKYSSLPYGYNEIATCEKRKGKTVFQLEPDPAEQAIIARIQHLRADGWGYRRIARLLNAEHVPTKKGGQEHQRHRGRWAGKPTKYPGLWTTSTIRHILSRLAAEDAPSADPPTA